MIVIFGLLLLLTTRSYGMEEEDLTIRPIQDPAQAFDDVQKKHLREFIETVERNNVHLEFSRYVLEINKMKLSAYEFDEKGLLAQLHFLVEIPTQEGQEKTTTKIPCSRRYLLSNANDLRISAKTFLAFETLLQRLHLNYEIWAENVSCHNAEVRELRRKRDSLDKQFQKKVTALQHFRPGKK